MATAGQWQKRAANRLKQEATGRHLSREAIRETERGPAGRVTAKEFRTWAAKEITEKGYITATTTGKTRRDWDMAPANREVIQRRAGPEAHRAEVESRVRKWIHDQTAQDTAAPARVPHLTPPMVQALLHTHTKEGRSAVQIMAAMVMMAAEGELTVMWRVEGSGGGSRNIWTEIERVLQEWGEQANRIVSAAQRGGRVQQVREGRLTALDFGSGWNGASEGIANVMAVYGIDKERQLLGRTIGTTVPDMRMDFTKGKGDLVKKAMQAGKLKEHEMPYCHFSPSCTQESILQHLEKAQGRGSGEHAGKERSAGQVKALEEMVEGIRKHRHRVPGWSYTVEQPRGSAVAKMDEVREVLGEPVEVRQCCYGWKHCKPTWVWTDLYPEWWQPRPFKEGECQWCQACNTGTRHEERMTRRDANDKRPPAGTSTMKGYSRDARWNRINPNLAAEWAAAAMEKWTASADLRKR